MKKCVGVLHWPTLPSQQLPPARVYARVHHAGPGVILDLQIRYTSSLRQSQPGACLSVLGHARSEHCCGVTSLAEHCFGVTAATAAALWDESFVLH